MELRFHPAAQGVSSSMLTTMKNLIGADEVLPEHLQDPAFRAEWERTALARAVALAVVGYPVKHNLTQTQLAKMLGMRQPHIARVESGEPNPSLEAPHSMKRKLETMSPRTSGSSHVKPPAVSCQM